MPTGLYRYTGLGAVAEYRGTTWRKLPPEQRDAITDAQSAKALMLAQPAIIKRPLLEGPNGEMLLGFKIESYQEFIHNQPATEVQ